MIYIKKGKEPASLTKYRKEKFAYFDGFDDKDGIRDNLLKEQGYLCAYCMQRISRDNMKIEHWRPEELLTEIERLDYTNMLGCCQGHFEGGKFKDDICDSHKKSTVIVVNPTDLKTIDKIAYKHSGEIYSEDEAIQKDLDVTLNLNCESQLLKENRKAALEAVKEKLGTMQRNGLWNKKLLHTVYNAYTNTGMDGRKKEYAGIVTWYIGKRLKNTR